MEKTKEQKILKLKNELECKQQMLSMIPPRLENKQELQNNLEKEIEQSNSLIMNLQAILAEMENTIPNFDVNIYKQYKQYDIIKTRIEEYKNIIDKSTKQLEVLISEKESTYTTYGTIQQQIAEINKEIALLQSEK